jgi:hypothetical protein
MMNTLFASTKIPGGSLRIAANTPSATFWTSKPADTASEDGWQPVRTVAGTGSGKTSRSVRVDRITRFIRFTGFTVLRRFRNNTVSIL